VADLQSAAINHSATCAAFDLFAAPLPLLLQVPNEDPFAQLRRSGFEEVAWQALQAGDEQAGSNQNFALCLLERGAGEGIRTPDRLITNQVLYQLSYASP
jgi:hypothetical protein